MRGASARFKPSWHSLRAIINVDRDWQLVDRLRAYRDISRRAECGEASDDADAAFHVSGVK
jgi:hypothetical protein